MIRIGYLWPAAAARLGVPAGTRVLYDDLGEPMSGSVWLPSEGYPAAPGERIGGRVDVADMAVDPSLLLDRDAVVAKVKPEAKARAGEIWDLALTDPHAYLELGSDPRDRSILSLIAPTHPALRGGR